MSPILVLTHLLAASAGAFVTYLVTLASRNEAPHLPHREAPNMKRFPVVPWVIILASVLVIGIGLQAYLARQDDRARDRRDDARQCQLDASVASLYQVLNDRTEANKRLSDAKDARADAQAAVILVAARANANPPKTPAAQAAVKAQFDQTLKAAQKAEAELVRVRAETAPILADQKPYKLPAKADQCKPGSKAKSDTEGGN